MCRRCGKVHSPGIRSLQVQPREANERLRVGGPSLRRLGDDRKIACELTVEVQFSDGVPRGWMEEDKRTAEYSEDVPHEIVAADVVQFVAQNIFELGAVLLETDIGQQDGWANPPKGGGGCYPRQDEQSCPFNVETPGKRAKCFRDFGRWVGGETKDPLELSLLPDVSEEHIAQDQ